MSRFLFAVFCFLLCESYAISAEVKERLRNTLKPFFVTVKAQPDYEVKNKAKVTLGRTLFFDKRLSKNSDISCNSCHDLKNYGTNGEHYKKLREAGESFRDVPSIYNVNSLELFAWDGGKKTLADQIKRSLENEYEMGCDEKTLIERLKGIEGYKNLFSNAYPDKPEVTYKNIIDCLEVYINGLVTPSPIDRFIDGDDSQLTDEQIEGGKLFDSKNCYTCHTGSNFGGQMMQKMGVTKPWPNQKDQGYYHVTNNPGHKMIFRVSPLRNIEKTPPYFHDGSSRRIWDAIKKMAQYEMGIYVDISDILKMQSFLKSFTGELPLEYIKEPSIPE